MRVRAVLASALVIVVGMSVPVLATPTGGRGTQRSVRAADRAERALPEGFMPAAIRAQQTGRWFVQLRAPSVVAQRLGSALGQQAAAARVARSQEAAIRQVESLGGRVFYRYSRLVNAFSAEMTPSAAAELAARADVRLVEPVPVVARTNDTSVPFIGAKKVWNKLNVKGKGIHVGVVDTGVDYTHADFGGPGTVEAYESNDPTVIEPGTFPTKKVIAGYDFVGENYDVLDDDPTNDVPVPDPDPLDDAIVGAHGTHVAGTCCGKGVPGKVGAGVAPKAKIVAVKVWASGSSTADVLVAGYEFAMDPNRDGSTKDAVDVLSFSGGVDYGAESSTEAQAAQAVVDGGTVFVASAGNSGNQWNGGQGYIVGTPASAPGVVGVAASIDQFAAQTLTVDSPAGVTLPEGGPVVWQDWSAPFTVDLVGEIVDARQFDPPSDPSGIPVPSDRILCDATPAGAPFAGKLALVYKGSFGAGDCYVEDKVIRAQEAGAIGVVIWDGFGGLPGAIGTGGNEDLVAIPAVDLSGADSEALAEAISPNAPAAYNEVPVTVTVGVEATVIPGYEDHLTDFTSEGPARITSALKPDISAPGSDITSALAGTGDGAATYSGTSMAAPHVSGVAALLREIHPTWSPKRIKAVLMNQAKQDLANLDGSAPVPATIMGSGRVNAFKSAKTSNLAMPGSISLGLRGAAELTTFTRTFRVFNLDDTEHRYVAIADVRYTDFAGKFAKAKVSVKGSTLAKKQTFKVPAGKKVKVVLEVTLDPGAVPAWQQEWGWYYWNPNVDGQVAVEQKDAKGDRFHVPWHVAALATADSGFDRSSLDLTGGSASLSVTEDGLGVPAADLFVMGAKSPAGGGEEDLTAIGARSFTGSTIDGTAELTPDGVDEFAGIGWQDFLWQDDYPAEPVEFVAAFNQVHNTTETLEVDVFVDIGADGVFADPTIGADALVVKLAGGWGGSVCVFSLPSDFSECDALYWPDYSSYNADVVGLVVDAGVLGLTNAESTLAYGAIACTGLFAGDVAAYECDAAGAIDPATGTYSAVIDVTDPPLQMSSLICGGFFGGDRCAGGAPVAVDVGSAAPGDDPSILAVFPNNPPGSQAVVIPTST